jgi:hypothetical protein
VAITTSFGVAHLKEFKVITEEVLHEAGTQSLVPVASAATTAMSSRTAQSGAARRRTRGQLSTAHGYDRPPNQSILLDRT